MTVIITMAGKGSRFREAGYDCPKFMIEAKGKTLFEWSLDSLDGYARQISRYIFVTRVEDYAKPFIRTICEQKGITNFQVIELEHQTDGQATTCMFAMPYCDSEEAIMVYNIDTYVEPPALKYADISGDGYMPCFHAPGDHWSFVKLDERGQVVDIQEKTRISDNCTLGAYYFSSARLYEKLYNEIYAGDTEVPTGEKYIAPMYNLMLQKELPVRISIVDAKKVHVLGTPAELDAFCGQNDRRRG